METPVNVFYTSDMYVAGRHAEEGYPIHGHKSYIVAEMADGSRFILKDSVLLDSTVTDEYVEEFGVVTVVHCRTEEDNTTQKRRIRKIESHLDNGGKLNPELWESIDPAYGSDAYAKLDSTGYFYHREKAQDKENY